MKKIKYINKLHIVLISIILILIIVFSTLYLFQENFRNWVDIYVLRKDITEKDIVSIDLETDKSNQVYVYNKYIALLNNQVISIYNNYGEELTSINVNINKALFDSDEKYLAIAENGGGEIYLILDKTYLWSNKIEGEILQIHVNRNGYVAVITKDATYRSILNLYNPDGTQLFKSYFAQTRIIDVSISNDNKYVAIGELDTTGAIIKSNVKIISIEEAKKGNGDAIKYTYNEDSGKLLTNVKYQPKNQIVCMYDDCIDVIKDTEKRRILDVNDKSITYMSINSDIYVVYIQEENNGVFKINSHINIINTQNDETKTYNIEESPKGLYTNDEIIAINVGTELYFLDKNGWLLKRYSSNREITNVLFSKNIAAIIYKDKIMVVNL